ncbi:MAG TPA: peptidoglycan recognition family protein [Coleofasciculaceae cyanobacterium]
MSIISRYSKLLIILVTAIACIIVGFNYRNNAPTPPIAQPNLPIEQKATEQKATEQKATEQQATEQQATEQVELPPISKTKANSVDSATYKTTLAFEQYKPRYTSTDIHPSNYGERYSIDVDGNPLDNPPIVVLHETVNSARSAINTFKTPHDNDNNQVSYHALISLDGTIIYLLPADKRAFGAGNSVFESTSGIETVQTNPNLPPSVNNFAYHISLETPPDGRGSNNQEYHSGYTESQYKSLAWLLALSNIPDDRITTHKNVDRSAQKIDPRSFDFDKFLTILHTYRQPNVDKISAQ